MLMAGLFLCPRALQLLQQHLRVEFFRHNDRLGLNDGQAELVQFEVAALCLIQVHPAVEGIAHGLGRRARAGQHGRFSHYFGEQFI